MDSLQMRYEVGEFNCECRMNHSDVGGYSLRYFARWTRLAIETGKPSLTDGALT